MVDRPPIEWLPGEYVVVRCAPGVEATLPDGSAFGALLRGPDETTVVAPAAHAGDLPAGERSGPWRALRMVGPLPHDAVGILAHLSAALARRSVPIFALSTFDTDYVLVPADRAADVDETLRTSGYSVLNDP